MYFSNWKQFHKWKLYSNVSFCLQNMNKVLLVHSKFQILLELSPHPDKFFMIISQLISTCHIGVYDFMNQYSQLYIMYWVCRVAHQELKSYFCNPHYKMELSKSRQLVKNLAKFSDFCSLGLAKSVCSDLVVENSLVTGQVTRLFWKSSDYIINLAT